MKSKWNMLRTAGVSLALILMAHSAWAGEAMRGDKDPRRALGWAVGSLVFVLLWVAFKAAVVAFSLCATELAPTLFRRGRGILVASPIKSFLVGLVNVALGLTIGVVLARVKVLALLGVLLLIAVFTVLFASRALIYQWFGMRWRGELPEPEVRPSVRAHCQGALGAELAFLIPCLGFPLADTIASLTAAGALILAMMTRERAAEKGVE